MFSTRVMLVFGLWLKMQVEMVTKLLEMAMGTLRYNSILMGIVTLTVVTSASARRRQTQS